MANILKKLFSGVRKSNSHPFCSVIIAAAGSSNRMNGENKLFAELDGIPVIVHTMLAFQNSPLIDEIIIVTREDSIVTIADMCAGYKITKATKIVVGGKERNESVQIGAMEVSPYSEYIAVQDGARPLVTKEIIDDAVRKAYQFQAAAPAIPVSDTIKVADNNMIVKTLDRDTLVAVQTPQVFKAEILKAALKNAHDKNIKITDDCGAVEALGVNIALSIGSHENIKITTPIDIVVAESILEARNRT